MTRNVQINYIFHYPKLGWVCENDHLPTISVSVFFCGAFTGGLLFGWIADRFGKFFSVMKKVTTFYLYS